jgi:hypothetical protein
MLLTAPHEEGFHCLMSDGGTLGFNRMDSFYEKYEYVKDATSEEVAQFHATHAEFNGLSLAS